MYRWCSKCNEKRNNGDKLCPNCRHRTEIELDVGDTLRFDARREFVITKQLSHFTDAGMSAVYLAARKDDPNRAGAIKVAKSSKVDALTREAEVLQKLKHPHIIRLVHPERALWQDRQDDTPLHFFALEYMEGGSLKDLLKQKQKLSLDEAVPIILAVGQALAYAHENNYIHLDVKPANILFGKEGRIVLSDFGIARAETQATELKKRIGTLFYNSPEQLQSPPRHSHQADIYALGIILYEMLVGMDRFRQHRSSSSSKEESQSPAGAKPPAPAPISFNNLPPPRKLEPRIPRAVERVILKAIAPDPANRYTSVPAMLDDLGKAADRSLLQKKRLLLVAGGGMLLALALIALGIFFIWSNSSTGADRPASITPINTTAPAEVTPPLGVVIITSTRTPTPTETSTATPTVTSPPTPTRTPTLTPTATISPTDLSPPTIDGFIELIAPPNESQVPGETVEFRWRWREDKGCAQPPDGYAFEIRVWRDDIPFEPLGAIDARREKWNIQCSQGIRSFTIGKIKETPGSRGEGGRLRWDVVLVQLEPRYQPVVWSRQHFVFFMK